MSVRNSGDNFDDVDRAMRSYLTAPVKPPAAHGVWMLWLEIAKIEFAVERGIEAITAINPLKRPPGPQRTDILTALERLTEAQEIIDKRRLEWNRMHGTPPEGNPAGAGEVDRRAGQQPPTSLAAHRRSG